jgi:hypothetical protein
MEGGAVTSLIAHTNGLSGNELFTAGITLQFRAQLH